MRSLIFIYILVSAELCAQDKGQTPGKGNFLEFKQIYFPDVEAQPPFNFSYQRIDRLKNKSTQVGMASIRSCAETTKVDSIFNGVRDLHFWEISKDSLSSQQLMVSIKLYPNIEFKCLLPVLEAFERHPYLKRYILDLRSHEFLIFFGKNLPDD